MPQTITANVQRELYLTPEVTWFLEKCGNTENAKLLCDDICRLLHPDKYERSGCIFLSAAPTFLIFVCKSKRTGDPDRVLVWHGPTDGIFFKESLFKRALTCGGSLV